MQILYTMAVEIITREDLMEFRDQLLSELRALVIEQKQRMYITGIEQGYKTSDVKKLLGCSTNKLIALRIKRNIRTKKVGGTLYYNKADIKKLLEDGF